MDNLWTIRSFKNFDYLAFVHVDVSRRPLLVVEMFEETGEQKVTLSTSSRWGEVDDHEEQAHREACGTLRALETYAQRLQGKIVLHVTDCTPVSNAIEKGSKCSEDDFVFADSSVVRGVTCVGESARERCCVQAAFKTNGV